MIQLEFDFDERKGFKTIRGVKYPFLKYEDCPSVIVDMIKEYVKRLAETQLKK